MDIQRGTYRPNAVKTTSPDHLVNTGNSQRHLLGPLSAQACFKKSIVMMIVTKKKAMIGMGETHWAEMMEFWEWFSPERWKPRYRRPLDFGSAPHRSPPYLAYFLSGFVRNSREHFCPDKITFLAILLGSDGSSDIGGRM